jgi:cobalt-zinc-cadmium efflux system protein
MSSPHTHHHGHDHHHRHGHDSTGDRSGKLIWALGLTAAMLLVEIVGGWWSGSLALLADAGHMAVDSLALLLALIGARMAMRPADARRSYGYGRIEVLVGWIVYEAVVRLQHPTQILSGLMLGVAVAGLLVNAVVLRTLHGHAHDDVNLAGASLHVLGDLLGSMAAVGAALAIRWLGWLWADPALSLIVAVLLLGSAWRLLRRSSHILLEGVPEGLDTTAVEAALREADDAIRDVHHLHLWQLASGSRMATVHAELRRDADGAQAMRAINDVLRERFGVQHVTVQIDTGGCLDRHGDCAEHVPH